MDLEGTEICDWLTSRGITCVLLKYRVPDSGPTMKNGQTYYREVQTALQDAQRTLGLVRQHAAEWHVDPHKVGEIGFSAGGHLAAAVSTHFAQRTYPPVDVVDEQSCRPDFAIVVYPGHLWTPGTNLSLRPDIRVRADTPPTFLLHAEDDNVDDVRHSVAYYVALKEVGVPTEMHCMRRAVTLSACVPPNCPSVAGPRWWSSGCTPSACSALRKTEHAQGLFEGRLDFRHGPYSRMMSIRGIDTSARRFQRPIKTQAVLRCDETAAMRLLIAGSRYFVGSANCVCRVSFDLLLAMPRANFTQICGLRK